MSSWPLALSRIVFPVPNGDVRASLENKFERKNIGREKKVKEKKKERKKETKKETKKERTSKQTKEGRKKKKKR